jgi:hypothetical protein
MKPEEAIPLLQRGLVGEIYDEKGYLTALGYEALDAIDSSNCPTLVQRPHGEWEHWGSPFTDDTIANSIVCTRCKARYVEIDGEVFNFCPNCGADMRRKEGESN